MDLRLILTFITKLELMNIQEITQNMSQTIEKMTQQQKFDLLLSAKIIDKDGYYHPQFFSDSTAFIRLCGILIRSAS